MADLIATSMIENGEESDSDYSEGDFCIKDLLKPRPVEVVITEADKSNSQIDLITDFTLSGSDIVIKLRQRKRDGIAHQLWPAATFLAEYLVQNPSLLHNSSSSANHVLELGAGIGATGLFLAKVGLADRVTLTDLAEALDGLQTNIAMNNLSDNVSARELCWGQKIDVTSIFEDSVSGAPIVAIAADVIYWEELFAPFLQTIRDLLLRNCPVIVAHVKRWKRDEKFLQMAKKMLRNIGEWKVLVETVDHSPVPADDLSLSHDKEVETQMKRQVRRIYHFLPLSAS